jgi:hypothetical protein
VSLRLKHHSHDSKIQQLGQFSLFRNHETVDANPLVPIMFSMTCVLILFRSTSVRPFSRC